MILADLNAESDDNKLNGYAGPWSLCHKLKSKFGGSFFPAAIIEFGLAKAVCARLKIHRRICRHENALNLKIKKGTVFNSGAFVFL